MENARLRQQVADLAAKVEAALAEIERLKRSGKRQATPVSKGSRSQIPGGPDASRGKDPSAFAPAPDAVTGVALDVPVARAACPRCGGDLEGSGSETVWITGPCRRRRPARFGWRSVAVWPAANMVSLEQSCARAPEQVVAIVAARSK